MRDLSQFKGCPAPIPVTLEGRYLVVEPYERDKHLKALWDGLGEMGINPLLLYFTNSDFAGIEDFDRWLDLFRQTATEVCPPAGAAHVIERAERIARSLHMAVEDTARGAGMTPSLR